MSLDVFNHQLKPYFGEACVPLFPEKDIKDICYFVVARYQSQKILLYCIATRWELQHQILLYFWRAFEGCYLKLGAFKAILINNL